MSVKFGRLEAYLTSPAGTYLIKDNGITYSVSLAAGYFGTNVTFSAFLASLAAWMNANSSATWTVTCGSGEAGTGLVTIGCDYVTGYGWSFSAPTAARAILGLSGNIADRTSTTYVATSHALGIWLPTTPLITDRGYNDAGTYVTDMRQTVSPRGHVNTVWSNSMTENALLWRFCPLRKTLISGEVTTNESFEKFWRACILGESEGFTPGPKIDLYWDADTSTLTTYRIVGLTEHRPTQVQQGWTGIWDIAIPRVIKVPT